MIENKDGRARSERTKAELEEMLKREMAGLRPEEREALNIIIKELSQAPQGPTLLDTLTKVEYKRTPVDMETFVKDPYYLGKTCDNIYPKLLSDLEVLFSGGYHEAILTGSTGWGKTHIASIGVCRVLYELSCMQDPHKSFGLSHGSNLSILCTSVNVTLATKVVFEAIATKIKDSPYFEENFKFEDTKSEMRFPNGIWVAARASTDTSALGLNAMGAFMDEQNFLPRTAREAQMGVVDRAESIYNNIQRRMKGRFQKRGKLPGMLFVVSSKKTLDDFTAKRIRESKDDPTVFVRDYCLTGDTKIPLLDGTTSTLSALVESHGSGDPFWVYSIDANNQIVPGRAHHPRKTSNSEPVLKVLLDSGESVRATPWHPFRMLDGTYKRADELHSGDSLAPLYRRVDERGYEEVAQPCWEGRWQTTHHMVARQKYGSWPKRGSDGQPTVIHHENHNKRDNRPENLTWMEWTRHQEHHNKNMGLLLEYVRTDEHRKYASEHMAALHKDPKFVAERNVRGRAQFKAMWADPDKRETLSKSAGTRLSIFHTTERGRQLQRERNLKRWEGKRSITLEQILEGAKIGASVTVLAEKYGTSTGCICKMLKVAKLPKYSELKRSHGHFSPNHKVVSIENGGVEPVYDLTVDEHSNFAVGAEVFVHNSLWETRPDDQYSADKFWVLGGNETVHSKVLTDAEYAEIKTNVPENVTLIQVPEDFRRDFERDIEGSLRDLAGVASVAINPFIHRRESILEAVDHSRSHPFSSMVYDPSKKENFIWASMVREVVERDGSKVLRPILNPRAARRIHIDPSYRNDATGFCMAHIGGWKDVPRRAADGKEYMERAPLYVVDFILQIVPPAGGEIILSELRHLVYDLHAHGYMITGVTLDQWNSVDTIQQLNQRGFQSQVLSVDTTVDPYENLKTALYENRVSYYEYPVLTEELQQLERHSNGKKTKIDHPPKGKKDVADALSAVLFSLSSTGSALPLPFVRGLSYSGDAWMEEQRQSMLAGNKASTANMDLLPVFLKGGGGDDGGWNGSGGDGGGWYPG